MSPQPDAPAGQEFDIAIVGGGLAGLFAATALSRSDRRIVLIAPERGADRRTTALLGESVAALRRLGIWPVVADAAQPLRRIRIVDATERLLRAPEVLFDAGELGVDAFGYNVPNELLLDAFDTVADRAGLTRIRGAATRFEVGPDGVTILTDEDRVTARLVVAADGRGSPTRAAAGIAFRTSGGTGQAALVANLSHESAHDDISTEFHTGAGPFTFVPLPGRNSALVWVTEAEEAARLKALAPDALAQTIEQRAHSFLGTMTLNGPAQVFPLMTAVAEHLAARRIALIGEAAHVLPPIAAQGFNLTIRDVEALSRLVDAAADPGSDAVIGTYDRDRRADIRLRKLAVGLLNRSLSSPALPVQALRSAGLLALDRLPMLRRVLMREGLGLK